jgi:hypothetical protein
MHHKRLTMRHSLPAIVDLACGFKRQNQEVRFAAFFAADFLAPFKSALAAR